MSRTPERSPGPRQPAQPGKVRAVVLAIVVHAAFFALIVFGVSWQSRPTPPVQAELWDKLPPAKTAEVRPPPKAEPPKPEPPKAEPPKPEPPKPEPKPEAKPEPAKPDPAALALKLEREKKEKEKRERLERQREEEKRKKEKEAAEKKQRDREDAEKRKREKDEAEKKKREEDERRRQEEERKAAAERARAEALAAQRSEENKYVDAIKAKIRNRANVPDTVPPGTEVHVRLRILPGGEVLDIVITKRSGNPAYDAAIERAIKSAQPLPVPPPNSELFPRFRDLNLNIKHER